jgi:hypothetical protein
MRRVLAAGCVVMGLVVAGVSDAVNVKLPALFASQIAAIKRDTHAPPVLLPSSLGLEHSKYYASGGPSGSGYSLQLGAVKGCGGANACFIADFLAMRGGRTFGTAVTIKGATKAAYAPGKCGASCAPASIDFVVGGVLYTFQASTLTSHHVEAALIAAARSAIAAGPR